MAAPKTNSPTSQQSKVTSPMEQAQSEQRPTPQAEPNPEQIAERAYEIFLSRGGEHGRDQEDGCKPSESSD
jgi:hypothetical protein